MAIGDFGLSASQFPVYTTNSPYYQNLAAQLLAMRPTQFTNPQGAEQADALNMADYTRTIHNNSFYGPDGQRYMADLLYGDNRLVDNTYGARTDPVTGYRVYPYREAEWGDAFNGTGFDDYDAQGNYLGGGTFDINSSTRGGRTLMQAIAAAVMGGTMAGALGGGGTGGAEVGGVAGGEVSGAGGFVGEGATSGVGAWDTALANSPSWSAAGGLTGAQGPGGATEPAVPSDYGVSNPGVTPGSSTPPVPPTPSGGGGTPPPPNPNVASPSMPFNLNDPNTWWGLGTTIAGGIGGAQGTGGGTTTERRELPDYLRGPVVNDLIPRTQGLLGQQAGDAAWAGRQVSGLGMDLLGRPIAGNGVGQVQMRGYEADPYATGILDDLQRRSNDMIGRNLQGIQGNAVGVGGLGGSRQGVAQADAITRGADNFAGQAANFMSGIYQGDRNRALQQYGMDQGFYGQQRGQDQTQTGLGSGLLTQGFNTGWQPIRNATDAYQPFTGFGTSSSTQPREGGGWQGAAGGLLAGASLGRQMGWW